MLTYEVQKLFSSHYSKNETFLPAIHRNVYVRDFRGLQPLSRVLVVLPLCCGLSARLCKFWVNDWRLNQEGGTYKRSLSGSQGPSICFKCVGLLELSCSGILVNLLNKIYREGQENPSKQEPRKYGVLVFRIKKRRCFRIFRCKRRNRKVKVFICFVLLLFNFIYPS